MNFLLVLHRLHEELRRSIEAQMEIVRRGEGSGAEKEVMENMQHQLQRLQQVYTLFNQSYTELLILCLGYFVLFLFWG